MVFPSEMIEIRAKRTPKFSIFNFQLKYETGSERSQSRFRIYQKREEYVNGNEEETRCCLVGAPAKAGAWNKGD